MNWLALFKGRRESELNDILTVLASFYYAIKDLFPPEHLAVIEHDVDQSIKESIDKAEQMVEAVHKRPFAFPNNSK